MLIANQQTQPCLQAKTVPSPPKNSHVATRSLLVSGASQALRVCIVFDSCSLRILSGSCTSRYFDGLQLFLSRFRKGLELLYDGGDVDVDGVCLRAPSVLQLCREIFQSVDLFRDEFSRAERSTCFWSSSNYSCDNFSTAPERRCLRDFGPVASCIASWIFFFKALLAIVKSMAVFIWGIPPISSGEENCCG